MAEMKYLDKAGLSHYDEKMKAFIKEEDAKIMKAAEDLGVNYDAAGTAATKVKELEEGAVAANAASIAENKEAIAKLNGDATTAGSVAKAVADAKALVDADIDGVEAKADANTADVTALKTRVGNMETKAQGNTDEITGLKARMDGAEADVAAIKEDIGNVDNLSTTNKTLSGAINEVLAAVGTGGTAAVVTLSAKGASDTYANVYELKQGDTLVGTINIPKDMVVESGDVVDLADNEVAGYPAGTYIKLVLANVADPLYINAASLVDIYKAAAGAAQVQVEINSDTREISAYIVAGSVTSAELADSAVITAKIADKNVTKAKLSAEIQASLDKADVAEANAIAHSDSLNADMDTRVKAVEAKLGSGEGSVEEIVASAKQEAIDAAAQDASAKDSKVLTDANAHTDEKVAENKALIDANTGDITSLKENMNAAEGDIVELQASLADGGATAVAIADAKKAGTDAQASLSAYKAANDVEVQENAAAIADLQSKVGDGFVEITTAEIDAMFETI